MDVAGESGSRPNEHLDVRFVDQQRTVGTTEVALAVRRAVGELSCRREVLPRDLDVAPRLQDEQIERTGVVAHHPTMGHPGGHHDVVARRDRQAPEHALQRGVSRVHVSQFVADGVAVQRARRRRRDVEQLHVVVTEQRRSRRHCIARPGRQLRRAQVVRGDRLVGRERRHRDVGFVDADDRARRVTVVEQARRTGEPLLPHHLLGDDVAVDAVQCVALAGNIADGAVVRHLSLPSTPVQV